MNLYKEQFSKVHDFPRADQPSKILVIASTARCGSHMLGHALHKTKQFGYPLEYANTANLPEWKKRFGKESLTETLIEIQKHRTSPNGVFAIKIHYSHISQFGGFSNLMKCLPNAYYVHLSRGNVLEQAVSLSIAEQTGVWISGQEPINNRPSYNFRHIKRCLRRTILDDSSWRYILGAAGCKYIQIEFDHVRTDLAQSIEKIAAFMNVELDPGEIPSEQVISKQGNSLNVEWADRFVTEFNPNSELLSLLKLKNRIKRLIY